MDTNHPQVARSRAATMAAAREILLAEGADGVTFAAVAERSGIGRSTVYRHWPTPVHLLRDVLAAQCELVHHVPAGDTRDDLLAELRTLSGQLVHPQVRRPLLAIMERATRDASIAHLCEEFHRACTRTLAQIVRSAEATGQLTALDLDRAVSTLVGPIFYRALVEQRPADEAFVAGVADAFLRAHHQSSSS